MKNKNILIIMIINSFLLTGCYQIKTPEQLIEISDEFNDTSNLKKQIENILPFKSKLIMPQQSISAQSINEIDIDGDSKKEIIAFYQTEDEFLETKFGFIILENNDGKLILKNDISKKAYGIRDANFIDLDNDNKKEIIISWMNSSENNTYQQIYKIDKNDNLTNVFSKQCLDLKIVKIKNLYKIITYEQDAINNKLKLCLYGIQNNCIIKEDTLLLDSFNKNGYIDLNVGNIYNNAPGCILSLYKNEEEYIYNVIITIENNKFNVFYNDEDKNLDKNTYVKSDDIDEDGILEIGYNKPFIDSKLNDLIYLTCWYNIKENAKLELKKCSYYDYSDGFILNIPKQYKDKVTVRTYNKHNSKETIFYFYNKQTNCKYELLKIVSTNKSNSNNLMKDVNSIELGQNENNVLIGYINEDNKDKIGLNKLDKKYLLNNFTLLY